MYDVPTNRIRAAIALTLDKLDVKASGGVDKSKQDLLKENETTISVSYTGGGQGLKKRS